MKKMKRDLGPVAGIVTWYSVMCHLAVNLGLHVLDMLCDI